MLSILKHNTSTWLLFKLDIYESVHRDKTIKNQQDALYKLIYYSKSPLHISGEVFAHH
jgi:hypothetical protein